MVDAWRLKTTQRRVDVSGQIDLGDQSSLSVALIVPSLPGRIFEQKGPWRMTAANQ